MKPTLSKAKEFYSVLAFKEVYVCEILISEIERRHALYDCWLKEYSDKGLKEGLWGKVCKASSFVFNIFNANAPVYINLL